MFKQVQKGIAGVAVLAAIAVGAAAVAGAASDDRSGSGSVSGSGSRSADPIGHGPGETLLTGETADKVRKAAEEKVPGGTILRLETDSDGSPYEAHVRKSNGGEVVVKVNKDFEVTDVQSFGGPGAPGHGRSGAGYPAGPPATSSY